MANVPWPTEINPSISTLLQNAQRANPTYGKKSKQEAKLKRFKSSRANAANTDTTNLSEDMMGDMDPDEYKEHDHSSTFREKLKEWKEEEERQRKDDEEPGEPDDQDQEKDDSYREDRDDEEQREKELEPWRSKDDRESDPEPGVMAAPEYGSGEGDTGDEQQEQEEEENNQVTLGNPPEAYRDKVQVGAEAQSQMETTDNHDGIDGESQLELGGEKEQELNAFDDGSAQFTSLLTYADGFIIADPKKELVTTGELNLESTDTVDREPEPEEAIPESMRARYQKAFEKIILPGADTELVKSLQRTLRKFGVGVVETCAGDGIRVLILSQRAGINSRQDLFTHGYDKNWSGIRRGYFPWEKLMVIGGEYLIKPNPRVNDTVLYFAFAFDHALGSEGFASEHSPAVLANFQSCQRGDSGRRFIDRFSSKSPVHYFAQAVEAYLSGAGGGLSSRNPGDVNTLCTQEELYDTDRPMYTYLEYLFKRVNRSR